MWHVVYLVVGVRRTREICIGEYYRLMIWESLTQQSGEQM